MLSLCSKLQFLLKQLIYMTILNVSTWLVKQKLVKVVTVAAADAAAFVVVLCDAL